jgi:2'-5' RNA ligase
MLSLEKIFEKQDIDCSYSNIQIDMHDKFAQEVIDWSASNIIDKIVYDKEGKYGREDEIHCTILCGILDKDPEKIRKLSKFLKPFAIKIGTMSAFRSKEYDVLKLEVISGELHKIQRAIESNIPNHNTYLDYYPHITISYVNKNSVDNFIGNNNFEGRIFKVNTITFSSKDGFKEKLRLV